MVDAARSRAATGRSSPSHEGLTTATFDEEYAHGRAIDLVAAILLANGIAAAAGAAVT